ncbi:MAG: cell wall-binding repeat-containing protein [Coriobacteriales bacterium]|nr:cell wall-binding repeat-containing protein [Coriobacteriales bacterium]
MKQTMQVKTTGKLVRLALAATLAFSLLGSATFAWAEEDAGQGLGETTAAPIVTEEAAGTEQDDTTAPTAPADDGPDSAPVVEDDETPELQEPAVEEDDTFSMLAELDPLVAAGLQLQWAKKYGGTSFDSVAPTPDGGYVAVGSSYDAIIVKFDAGGNVLWAKSYGGSSSDGFSSVVCTPDGGYVAVGYSSSAGGDFSATKGMYDATIAKFDADGNKLWAKSYGGNYNDNFDSVAPTPDGSYVAVGSSYSTDGDFPAAKGQQDAIIAKFDVNGNKLWAKSYGENFDDFFFSVAPASDGGYVAAGRSTSDSGYDDAIMAKFDANGNKLWVRGYGGSSNDWFTSVTSTPDGGYVAVGSSYSADGDFPVTQGYYDAIIAKFDAEGNKLWAKSYGGSSDDDFISVTCTPDGGYVAVGCSGFSNGGLVATDGVHDIIIAKFDTGGSRLWVKGYGGNNTDQFRSAVPTSDGGYVAVGNSISNSGLDAIIAKWVPAPPQDIAPRRLDGGGGSRYKTMRSVVDTFLSVSPKPDTVILAKGTNFPDALSAAGLAGICGAPIVISETTALSAEAKDALLAAGPSKVYVLGDAAGSLPDSVLAEVRSAVPGASVERIAGPDRYATALALYNVGKSVRTGWSDTAIITRGDNFADALSASPFAWATHSAIFLCDPSAGLSAAALDALSQGNFSKVYILGEENSVPSSVITQLSSRGINGYTKVTDPSALIPSAANRIVRLAGTDRYHTSVLVAEESIARAARMGVSMGRDNTVIAKGSDFPDALSGGALAGLLHSTLVLVDHTRGDSDHALNSFIGAHREEIGTIFVLGDGKSISAEFAAKLEAAKR